MKYLYQDNSLSSKERAKDLLSHMTVREKAGQLNQHLYGFQVYERKGAEVELNKELIEEVEYYGGLGVLYGLYRADPWSGKTYENGLTGVLAPKAYNKIQKFVLEHSRLGIPMLLSTECPHGHQALDGYLLPVNLNAGATFHPELLRKAYEVCGSQLKDLGVHLALISVLDVLRDPRWGRSEECYSEDPYLSGELAKAAVTGIQGKGVTAVAKHFCAQGEGTGGINASAARIGERELREIHLPSAKACCQAGVQGIMAAYNEIDGIPCHSNKKLLTGILRGEMGFKGVVMADGLAIDRLDGMTGNNAKSAAMALKAGVDISLWDKGFTRLEEAYENGFVTMEELDRAVYRVLKLKFELGLFENPYIKEQDISKVYSYQNHPEALQLARESVCLLKNENDILPLDRKKISSIAVIGPNADELYHQLGDYTPSVREEEGITVLKGIKDFLKDCGENTVVRYSKGCGLIRNEENYIEEAVQLAKACDYTILVLGGSSSRFSKVEFDANGAAKLSESLDMDCGEGIDTAVLSLPGLQVRLTEAIAQTGKPVISVLIQGRPYAVTEVDRHSKALLCAFYPGMTGGQAIAEVIFGETCPSGHLPVSLPGHVGQLPVYYNYKDSYNAMSYSNMPDKALYSFGYGLSYTTFRYSDIKLKYQFTAACNGADSCFKDEQQIYSESIGLTFDDMKKGFIELEINITNDGNYDGYALIMLFIKDLKSSIIRRVIELKDFTKVFIKKGESARAVLHLDEEKLSIWNELMEFTMEAGDTQLMLSDGCQTFWQGKVIISE
ncbi:glycoside hydrolase family 3 N-terminal domain-containing protein [Anaerocolumna sp. AGMB13020]|uniref:glycoside hydrolase family 3 N-terminal domain-containing protein n=1 Tax=Anaerocolumna sp. AGMB13020 TaxID=3081750 RepID=UPI0029550908|nr:glycoside hydrolase family 3 N-terminal domain-containing protein [Anaerocolumna sp. AGMB13020]WOO37796.1 glycoside hydrolase family 3 N-terminal domain-containing protein [Anaerocolumna sp. AGMB13020]